MSTWPELTAAAPGKIVSFKGVAFAAEVVGDDFSPALAVHEFPGRTGASVTDLRRGAHPIRLRAIFAGDAYPDWMTLRDKIDAGGPDQFHHPVLGNFQAFCGGANFRHDARRRRYCEADLLFIQHEPDGGTVFARSTVMEPAETAISTMTEAAEPVYHEAAEAIADGLSGDWAAQVEAEADMSAAVADIDDALGPAEQATAGVDDALSQIDSALNTVLSPIDRAMNYVSQVEGMILSRVRRILSLPGNLTGRILGVVGRLTGLVGRLRGRPGQIAGQIAGLVSFIGSNAIAQTAAELTQAALTVQTGADYVGRLVKLEADV